MRVLEDFVIPAGRGRAILVPPGAVLRIHLVEDRQVGDCCFFNANDHREVFHVGQSWALNVMLGTGNAKSFRHFYSKPPRENVMLTVLEDTVRNHWGNMGGRCSKRLYALRDGDAEHRSCQENLAEARRNLGLPGGPQRHQRRARQAPGCHRFKLKTARRSAPAASGFPDRRRSARASAPPPRRA